MIRLSSCCGTNCSLYLCLISSFNFYDIIMTAILLCCNSDINLRLLCNKSAPKCQPFMRVNLYCSLFILTFPMHVHVKRGCLFSVNGIKPSNRRIQETPKQLTFRSVIKVVIKHMIYTSFVATLERWFLLFSRSEQKHVQLREIRVPVLTVQIPQESEIRVVVIHLASGPWACTRGLKWSGWSSRGRTRRTE